MPVLIHIKKDILRFRLCIFAYLFLIITASALNLNYFKPISSFLLSFISWVMGFALIPMIIQEDPLVGTTAFWMTRPIDKRDLLTAKAGLLLTLIVVIPLLLELCVMAVNGFSQKYIFLAIPEIIIKDSVLLVPAILLATLTPTLGRFVIAGTSIYAGIVLLGIIWFIVLCIIGLGKSAINQYAVSDYSLQLSKMVVLHVFFILGGAGLIIHQYLTRDRHKTILLAVLGYVLVNAAMSFWRYDFLGREQDLNSSHLQTLPLTVQLDTSHALIQDDIIFNSKPYKRIGVSVKMSDIFPKFAVINKITAPSVVSAPKELSSAASILESSDITIQPKEGLPQIQLVASLKISYPKLKINVPPSEDQRKYMNILYVPQEGWDQFKGHKGTYTARAIFDIYEFKKAFELSLQRGKQAADGPQQVCISDILRKPNGLTVVLRVKKINLLFDNDNAKKDPAQAFKDVYNHDYILINLKRAEAVLPTMDNTALSLEIISELISRFTRTSVGVIQLDFDFPESMNIGKDWLKDARLIRFDAVNVGQKRILIKQADFVVPAISEDKNGQS